ncbi:MAG: hypothetical protein AB7R55_12920 [Gemmatimonadales bacterium]
MSFQRSKGNLGLSPGARLALLVAAGVFGCGGETPDPFAQDLGGNVFIEVIPKRAAAISSTPSGIDCDSAWARLGNGASDPADRSGCRFGFFDGQQVRLDAAVRANYEIVGWEWSNVAQFTQSAPGGYTSICASGPACTLPALVETGRDYFVRLTLQPEPPPFVPGQNQLIDPGFELQAYRTGVSPVIPSGTGYWQGDLATIVTGAENGISPESGAKMLRCDASGPFGGGAGFVGCEVYQILDVSQFASLIDQDSVTLEATVRVNRVAGDSEDRQGAGGIAAPERRAREVDERLTPGGAQAQPLGRGCGTAPEQLGLPSRAAAPAHFGQPVGRLDGDLVVGGGVRGDGALEVVGCLRAERGGTDHPRREHRKAPRPWPVRRLAGGRPRRIPLAARDGQLGCAQPHPDAVGLDGKQCQEEEQ